MYNSYNNYNNYNKYNNYNHTYNKYNNYNYTDNNYAVVDVETHHRLSALRDAATQRHAAQRRCGAGVAQRCYAVLC
eukprot:5575371-Lingulodinium_polyedra.AAC.1